MRVLHWLIGLWRALFRSARVDADLGEEMRFHLDRETDANLARGMTPADARRAALLVFGSVDAVQEVARAERPGAAFRQVLQDFSYGIRLLRKAPVFGVTAIGIVGLGVGAATAVFSVVHGVMLRPLPFRAPERLVSIRLTRHDARNYPAAADAMELRQQRAVFDDVAFFENTNLNLVENGEPQRLEAASVSSNLFRVLGVTAALGRTFAEGEDQAGRERVVVLSDGLWRGRFGADSAIDRATDPAQRRGQYGRRCHAAGFSLSVERPSGVGAAGAGSARADP